VEGATWLGQNPPSVGKPSTPASCVLRSLRPALAGSAPLRSFAGTDGAALHWGRGEGSRGLPAPAAGDRASLARCQFAPPSVTLSVLAGHTSRFNGRSREVASALSPRETERLSAVLLPGVLKPTTNSKVAGSVPWTLGTETVGSPPRLAGLRFGQDDVELPEEPLGGARRL
jgi:hypothetical protein